MESMVQVANIPLETDEVTQASLSDVRSWDGLSPSDQVWYGVDSCI